MSTRIYDAFVTKTKPYEIIKKLVAKRNFYIGEICASISNYVISEASIEFDNINIPESNKYSKIEDKEKFSEFLNLSFKGILDDEMNFLYTPVCRLSIGLYPLRNKTLITVHGTYDMVALFIKNESDWLGTDYSYWNSTDKPESLSNREWNKRRDDWDKVFDYGATRVESMLTYTYCEKIRDIHNRFAFLLMKSDYSKVIIPSDDSRKKSILLNQLMSDFAKECKNDDGFDYVKYTHFLQEKRNELKDGLYDNELSNITVKPFNNKIISDILEKQKVI